MNGASVGHLILEHGEYQIFAAALLMGTELTKGHLVDKSEDAVFVEWTKKEAK
jgi:hypothetical protein